MILEFRKVQNENLGENGPFYTIVTIFWLPAFKITEPKLQLSLPSQIANTGCRVTWHSNRPIRPCYKLSWFWNGTKVRLSKATKLSNQLNFNHISFVWSETTDSPNSEKNDAVCTQSPLQHWEWWGHRRGAQVCPLLRHSDVTNSVECFDEFADDVNNRLPGVRVTTSRHYFINDDILRLRPAWRIGGREVARFHFVSWRHWWRHADVALTWSSASILSCESRGSVCWSRSRHGWS